MKPEVSSAENVKKSPTLLPPASGVTVRMYRQGLGDCFLLAFPTQQADHAFYMLIDCGVIIGTDDAETVMTAVAEDIEAATGGDIHLLVITHQHWDHLSGFVQAQPVFDRMRIHNLWLAWTEDPQDELASRLRAQFNKNLDGLNRAVKQARHAQSVAHINQLLGFFGSFDDTNALLGAAAKNNTEAALQAVRELAGKMKVESTYRLPGEGPLPLRTARGDVEAPGAHIYVLGPPHDEKVLKRINPTVKGQEVYTEDVPLTLRQAFLTALQQLEGDEPESAEERELRNLCYPFEEYLRIPPDETKQERFFQNYYWQPHLAWRAIDDDWLSLAGELALQLDSYTNNTSLVLAIELANTGKVLLFVADAQVGNWLSWDEYTWPVKNDAAGTQEVKINDLLARVVLYKVGHHGSHNATIRAFQQQKKGLELMTSPDLVAMLPVKRATALKKGWDKMPFEPLLTRLAEKTGGRIMSIDDKLPKPRPDGLSEPAWQAFKQNFHETELYLQYTVTD